MKISEFISCFKKDYSVIPKKLYTLLGITVLVIIGFIGLLIHIKGEDSRLAVTENEIKKQNAFIQQYHLEEREYQQQYKMSPKPIPKNQVENVQNELIKKNKNYNLNVLSINMIAQPTIAANQAPPDGIEFEMSLIGQWKMTVQYLQDFQKGSSLIAIKSLSMEPQQNMEQIKTTLKYKIYIE